MTHHGHSHDHGLIDREPRTFDYSIDVVIIGAGAAGMTAAIAAREAGAEVLVLERDEHARGSTSMSQGYVCAAGTKLQAQAGLTDDSDAFYEDIMARTKGTAEPLVARLVADEAGKAIDWLAESYKVPFVLNSTWGGHFGHRTARMHGVPSKRGEELLGALSNAASEIGVDIITGALVDRLYVDENDRVTGLRFTRPDGSHEWLGCDSVILATCGFGANLAMVEEFIPDFAKIGNYRYFGHEGNEGDGILWGRALGADCANMDAFQGFGALAHPHGITSNYDMMMAGGIAVNIKGERFSHELADISGQAIHVLRQPEGIAWLVFDDPRRAIVEDLPEFAELRDLGGVRSAQTIEELAALTELPLEALKATLADVADHCAGKTPCPYGRDFTKTAPLVASYHAVRVTGALYHTQGGLKIDTNGQVLRKDGGRLPNLFAAGGAAVGISGDGASGYLPAGGLCAAVTLGRVAGYGAAALVAQKQ